MTTKEVVASPTNYLNQQTMADAARIVADEEGMDCSVLEGEECRDLGMGSSLVERYSAEEQREVTSTAAAVDTRALN